jgi:Na+/glutamate symporter
MTASVAIACLATGCIVGWVIRSIFVDAEISRMQTRMQRQVRRWQCEAARARARAEQLARQLAALTGSIDDDDDPRPTETSD